MATPVEYLRTNMEPDIRRLARLQGEERCSELGGDGGNGADVRLRRPAPAVLAGYGARSGQAAQKRKCVGSSSAVGLLLRTPNPSQHQLDSRVGLGNQLIQPD